MKNFITATFSLLMILIVAIGCSQSPYTQGLKASEEGNYDSAIDAFYREIAENPQSARAWRELGVTFYEQDDLEKAEDALMQANAIEPDPRTNLYLGLIYEKQQMIDKAVHAYGYALSLGPGGKTEELIRAHLNSVIVQNVQREVNAALAAEDKIDVDTIPENTIAVSNFDAAYLNEDMKPLARGLAEFTSIDLAKVNSLRVIERLKIDAVLDELKLAQTDLVNQATAPRVGMLLGGNYVVTGSVVGLGEDQLRIDGVVVSVKDTATTANEEAEGNLRDIFKVQKAFVFGILDDLNIDLTREERDAISEVPTESYLALLAYSKGLDYERRGLYQEAQQSYQQAVDIDPGFGEAASRNEQMSASLSVGSAATTTASFEAAVTTATEPTVVASTPLDVRLVNTLRDIGGAPSPGERRPITEPPIIRTTATVIVKGEF